MELKIKAILLSSFLTLCFLLFIPFTWTDLVKYQLWQEVDIPLLAHYPFFSLFRIFHLIVGATLFCSGCYHSIFIIIKNREAHTVRNSPNYLLTDGYYGKVRHPMYSMFMLVFLGISIALISSLSIAVFSFVVIVLMILIFVEEKYMLKPIFKENYDEYRKSVRRYFLQTWQWILIILFLTVHIIGIFF
ncbi:MAG: hypothetical protein FK730_03325 [Asgard group archaeon]|nr:hypothetical protein [Asgard group archaeon]